MTLPNVSPSNFAILAVIATCSALTAQTASGYGPWHLGMSKAEVAAVTKFGPYKDVASTGGMETPNGFFDGGAANVSFVFGEVRCLATSLPDREAPLHREGSRFARHASQ